MAVSQSWFGKVVVVFLMVSLFFMGFEITQLKGSFNQTIKESLIGTWESLSSEDSENESQVRRVKPELDYQLLCAEDRKRVNEVLEWNPRQNGQESLKYFLAKTVTYPVQMACKEMKRLGKRSLGSFNVFVVAAVLVVTIETCDVIVIVIAIPFPKVILNNFV